MPYAATDFHQKSFRIKHDDDKFFTRLLSKESSKSNPSFRVYYNDVPRSVPFTWETRPGTPKHTFSDDNLNVPPLTPPPSYYTNASKSQSNKNARSNFLHTLLRRMNSKKVHQSSSPSSVSSTLSWSSSSSLSSFSDPNVTPAYAHSRIRRRFSSWGSSFDDKAIDHDQVASSRLCFGIIRKDNNGARIQGRGPTRSVKNALLTIVGRGSV